MAKRTDRLLVVDIEATCWRGQPPPGEESDVIEIGTCLLDLVTLERSARGSVFVQPTRSEVSPFCTALTHIQPEDVRGADSLAEACQMLRRDYRTRDIAWASFGDYDRRQLRRSCDALGVAYPFGPTHLNVKHLVAALCGLTEEPSLADALASLGLAFEGTPHRAGDDAWNVAAVLAALVGRARR